VQAWEWGLVYPAFWLITFVIGPIVDRLPMRSRHRPKGTYGWGL
jgi:hypothetical protein